MVGLLLFWFFFLFVFLVVGFVVLLWSAKQNKKFQISVFHYRKTEKFEYRDTITELILLKQRGKQSFSSEAKEPADHITHWCKEKDQTKLDTSLRKGGSIILHLFTKRTRHSTDRSSSLFARVERKCTWFVCQRGKEPYLALEKASRMRMNRP